jgi:hypothetical protein
MTILVELRPETEAWLAAQAAARGMDIPAYAAHLLDETAPQSARVSADSISQPKHQRPAGRKSLAQLFAESPFHGLDLEFDRDQDCGRDIAL